MTVDYFDGEFLEISFVATLVENIPATFDPRTVLVRGALARAVSRSPMSVLSGGYKLRVLLEELAAYYDSVHADRSPLPGPVGGAVPGGFDKTWTFFQGDREAAGIQAA